MTASSTPHFVNPVKERLKAGEVVLGITVRMARSAEIARIAKTTGHDFLFIDVQHSIYNLETISHIAQTAMAIGVAPLVRVRGINDPDVSLLLDNGVMGIIYPDVNTAADAKRAVEVCRFAPLGKRSVCGGYPHFDYRAVPLTQSVPQLDQRQSHRGQNERGAWKPAAVMVRFYPARPCRPRTNLKSQSTYWTRIGTFNGSPCLLLATTTFA